MLGTKPLAVSPVIPDWIPDKVSGRDVTIQGVHFLPFGHHGIWMRRNEDGIQRPTRKYWLSVMQEMHMSWALLINDGDSVIQKVDDLTPIEALLQVGVIPVIRGRIEFPKSFNDIETVKETVKIYDKYGLRPIWILGNEPLDPREWENGNVPPEEQAMGIITDRWMSAATNVINVGGIAGFPDGPCFKINPFDLLLPMAREFERHNAVYTGHQYGLGRPEDFPYDDVSKYGTPLTMEQYREELDDFADDPSWNEGEYVLSLMNAQRAALANVNQTAADHCSCFRGWERIVLRARETFGFDIAIALTEGGWTQRDRAGSGSDVDIRWPYTTPKMVAKKTVQMYNANTPYFATLPWLVADDAMQQFGYTGWPFDAWIGFAFSEMYGYEKPVISALKNSTATPLRHLAAMQCKDIIWAN